MTGLWVLVGVLLLATAAGLAHRARSGRIRDTAPRYGRATEPRRTVDGGERDAAPADSLREVLVGLQALPGERATLLQFSSAFCAPCRATRRILGEVSELVPGVAHVEVDAEQHLDLVRRLDIRKTPTTLVLDADGREIKRAAGQPRKADVLAALGQALP